MTPLSSRPEITNARFFGAVINNHFFPDFSSEITKRVNNWTFSGLPDFNNAPVFYSQRALRIVSASLVIFRMLVVVGLVRDRFFYCAFTVGLLTKALIPLGTVKRRASEYAINFLFIFGANIFVAELKEGDNFGRKKNMIDSFAEYGLLFAQGL
jgi:hypothetical protein